MYCSNCGAECLDEAQFCIKCGRRLNYYKTEKTKCNVGAIPEQISSIKNTTSGEDSELLEETGVPPKVRFPIAGIFFALHGMLFLYCLMHRNGDPTEPFVGIVYFSWKTWTAILLLFASAILLLLKKIKPSSIVLLIYSTWNMIYYITEALRLIPNDIQNYYPRAFLSVIFDILIQGAIALSYSMMAILAIMIFRKVSRFSTIGKRFWYIPGSLFCLVIALALLLRGIRMPWHFMAMELVFPATEILFSGWWLTHPYKVQSTLIYRPVSTIQPASSYSGKDIAPEPNSSNNLSDAPSFGYAVLGFFIPVAGLVLYLVWKEQIPFRAKSAGKGALIGVIVWIGLSILMVILSFVLSMIMLRGYY